MRVIDGICYADDSYAGPRIVSAEPVEVGRLLVSFTSGEKRLFDAAALEGPAFLPLKDDAMFSAAHVEHGFISWAGGKIDIAPEYVYEHGIPYGEV